MSCRIFKISLKVSYLDYLKCIYLWVLEPPRRKILQWISPEPYIQHHEQTKSDVLSGTGEWLLSHPDFQKWKKESVSSILWLHGILGSDKTFGGCVLVVLGGGCSILLDELPFIWENVLLLDGVCLGCDLWSCP
jgi:hypothetical protein